MSLTERPLGLLEFAVMHSTTTPTANQEGWKPYELHSTLCALMEHVAMTKNGRALFSTPPQHGKTEIAGKFLPVWLLKIRPETRILYVTYGDSLSVRKSELARELYKNSKIKGYPISRSSDSKSFWRLQGTNGFMYSTGIGGAITGEGFDLIIFDDPYKSFKEAFSATVRESVLYYWESTINTRLQDGGSVICIMTRWHRNDIASHLINQGWDHYEFPALAKKKDILKRKVGEALAPSIKSLEFLTKVKSEISSQFWNALYMCSPQSDDTSRIKQKWFKYYDRIDEVAFKLDDWPDIDGTQGIIYQIVDTAGTVSDKSDYFVVLTFMIGSGNKLLILDVYREKVTTARHESVLKKQYDKWLPSAQYVENANFGINVVQRAAESGLPVLPLHTRGQSKWIRAEEVSVLYEQGMIYHPRKASWLFDFEDEISSFPGSEHDDQFDCVAYMGIVARQYMSNVVAGTVEMVY